MIALGAIDHTQNDRKSQPVQWLEEGTATMTIQELLSAAQQLSLSDQIRLASQLMQTASQKLQASSDPVSTEHETADDPLIGLFAGSPDLAERAEEILDEEVQPASGFTWKV